MNESDGKTDEKPTEPVAKKDLLALGNSPLNNNYHNTTNNTWTLVQIQNGLQTASVYIQTK